MFAPRPILAPNNRNRNRRHANPQLSRGLGRNSSNHTRFHAARPSLFRPPSGLWYRETSTRGRSVPSVDTMSGFNRTCQAD